MLQTLRGGFKPLCVLSLAVWSLVPAHAQTIVGIVIDAQDQPVAGAAVTSETPCQLNMEGLEHLGRSETLTGPDGRFTITGAHGAADTWHRPAMKGVLALARVSAPGFGLVDTVLRAGDNRIVIEAGVTLGGDVIDAKGHPVAGVRLRYIGTDDPTAPSQPDSRISDVSTVTAPDGSWRLTGLPPQYTGMPRRSNGEIEVDDIHYLEAGCWNKPDGSLLIYVAPAASIHGTVAGPDGKPLPGMVVCSGDYTQGYQGRDLLTAVTGEDGGFTLGGLWRGQFKFHLFDPGQALFATALPVAVPEGGIVTLPTWTARPGMTVTARVLSSAGQTPLPGARLYADEAAVDGGEADNQGRIRVILPVDVRNFHIVAPSSEFVSTRRFLQSQAAGMTTDLGDVLLSKNVTLTGQALTPEGVPAAGAMFYVSAGTGDSGMAVADGFGRFQLDGLVGGSHDTISLVTGRGFESMDPVGVDIPADGKAPLELRLVVRPANGPQITGRVVDSAGQPLPGARLQLEINQYFGESNVSVVETDGAGNFRLPGFGGLALARIGKLTLHGYGAISLGAGSPDPATGAKIPPGKPGATNGWHFADSVMAKLDGHFVGQVVDGAGHPVVGAELCPLLPAQFPTDTVLPAPYPVTGPDGRFFLEHLPHTALTIMAASGRLFGESVAQNETAVTIRLTEPAPLTDTAKVALQVDFIQGEYSAFETYWDYLGEDKLRDLALRADEAKNPDGKTASGRPYSALGEWLYHLSRSNPRRAAAEGPGLLARYDPHGQWNFAEQAVAASCACYGDVAGVAWANAWVDRQKLGTPKPGNGYQEVQEAFQLAGVAQALKRPDAGALLKSAVAAAQAGPDAAFEDAFDWGADLSIAGLPALHLLDADLTPPKRLQLWCGAVHALASLDRDQATAAMANASNLLADPAVIAAMAEEAKYPNAISESKLVIRLSEARGALAEAVARAGEAQALDDTSGSRDVYRILEEAALTRQDLPAARAALLAGSHGDGWANPASYYASLAASFDGDLSRQLFARAAASPSGEGYYALCDNIPNYAYYRGFQDPAESRLLLESLLQQPIPPADPENSFVMMRQGAAAALFPLDPARAVAILSDSPDTFGDKPYLRARIVALLSTGRSKWSTLPPE